MVPLQMNYSSSSHADENDSAKPRSAMPAWGALEKHANAMKNRHMRDLFHDDENRFNNFHLVEDGILFDYSKNLITDETIKLLSAFAKDCNLAEMRDFMFSGQPINVTEERAVLHTALRDPSDSPVIVDGEDVKPLIRNAFEKMEQFCADIKNSGDYKHIVNIGIGGSDLGALMAYKALSPYHDACFDVHFVSNIDPTHLSQVLDKIDAQKTLFIVTSKTFTTLETLTNARSARTWLQNELGRDDVEAHFAAVTTNTQLAIDFGVREDHIFPMWNWVGGRFSIWSTVGLAFCIGIGFDNFKAFLSGAHRVDDHFLNTPIEKNIPALLGLIGVWNRNFMGYNAYAVSPYDQYLQYFPAYMQQIDMESNGKSVDRQGREIDYGTGPVVLGEVGTNAQHAFFQLFHQGSTVVPCDLIITATPHNPIGDHHARLMANALAQGQAMMQGRSHDDATHAFEGNRPTNTIIIDKLTPARLGQLMALYEHKIFVQGILWDINSFDQCGVELGKILAKPILNDLIADDIDESEGHDSSTLGLLKYLRDLDTSSS